MLPAFLLSKKSTGLLVLVHVRNHVVENNHHQIKVIGESLQLLGMLKQKVGPLNEVNLPVRLDEVVTNCKNIVDDHEARSLAADSVRQIEERLVVVVEVVCLYKCDLRFDHLLVDNLRILLQKAVLHFGEPFFIYHLRCHHQQSTSAQSTTLLGQDCLDKC